MITATVDWSGFQAAIKRYKLETGKTNAEVLVRQGRNLSIALRKRLMEIGPAKGQIRSERISAAKQGVGIKIRPGLEERIAKKLGMANYQDKRGRQFVSFTGRGKKRAMVISSTKMVRGKRLSLQAILVQKELNLRERGRGFRAYAAAYGTELGRWAKGAGAFTRFRLEKSGRYRQSLGSAALTSNATEETLQFTFGGPTSSIAAAMSRPSATQAIQSAVNDVEADITGYLEKRQVEAFNKALGNR